MPVNVFSCYVGYRSACFGVIVMQHEFLEFWWWASWRERPLCSSAVQVYGW